ncbi:MAG TPA: 6,7-dimethyl-8-ribityllumazine synthase [Steroidobacteraceae bacterium]|nr:6,7-dimethyl-8-ribityllumazine synthase [Steroidobacteraceae bacterium]
MTGSNPTTRRFDARPRRVVLVAARFNAALVDQLIAGASQAWAEYGGDPGHLLVERVPGAFELPLIAKMFAASGEVDAVVALGCVIRGDTPHFDYVAGECARGLMDAGLSTGVPVIFGVLTTENLAQAEERADVARMNKGRESLEAALEMIDLLAPAPKARARRKKGTRR